MASRVLVVGSGVIGLRTAVELLSRNVQVVLRSPKHPLHPSVASQGAGGLWSPYGCNDPRTDRWAVETLNELHPMAEDPNMKAVETVPTISLFGSHEGPKPDDFLHEDYQLGLGGTSPLPSWSSDPRLDFQHLTVEMLSWQNIVNKLRIPTEKEMTDAGYLHAWFYHPPIVDTPAMLEIMLEEVESKAQDVNLETGLEYESVHNLVEDAKSLNCDAVVNCTGLGAGKICNDKHVVGARGILHHYDRKNCIRRKEISEDEYGPMLHDAVILMEEGKFGSLTEPAYMIPRGDTIIVGGSYLEGDKEPTIRPKERARLLRNAEVLGIDTSLSKPVGEWTGFRPYRPIARLEIDTEYGTADGVKVVHSYGYGGSGWTVYVGAALEATRLLVNKE